MIGYSRLGFGDLMVWLGDLMVWLGNLMVWLGNLSISLGNLSISLGNLSISLRNLSISLCNSTISLRNLIIWPWFFHKHLKTSDLHIDINWRIHNKPKINFDRGSEFHFGYFLRIPPSQVFRFFNQQMRKKISYFLFLVLIYFIPIPYFAYHRSAYPYFWFPLQKHSPGLNLYYISFAILWYKISEFAFYPIVSNCFYFIFIPFITASSVQD